jgi:hypothetical protein
MPLFGIFKHDLSHPCPIHFSMIIQYTRSEFANDFAQCGLAWLDDLAGNFVGVDDRNAQFREKIRDRSLARRYAACE